MATICYKEIAFFSLKELQETFSTPIEHLTLNCASLGQQKENTIIIGRLTDVQIRKNVGSDIPPVMRLKLHEVLSTGNGLGFEVIIYGKNVKDLEDTLKPAEEDTSMWLSFANVTLINYSGLIDPWSKVSLKVVDREDGDDDGAQKQQITIFKLCQQPKEEFLQPYALLNDVRDKKRYTTFAVVKEVLKQTTVLNNKNKHTLLCIVDPSCFEPGAKRNEMLLHLFFNDSNDYLPELLQHGDILRLRAMVGELYKKEELKMYGKIFSSNAIVKFKRKEKDNEVTPITSNTTYITTDQDKKMVTDLREWWTKHCDCFDDRSQSDDSVDNVKKLFQIQKPVIFTLNCLIRTVRVIESRRAAVLRVTDGTNASVLTTTVNIDDATEEFSSQCGPMDNVIGESSAIDVTIFSDMFEKAARLKEGDFIELVNLKCENINDGLAEEEVVLDFFMKESSSDINIIFPRSCKAKTIMNAVDDARVRKIGPNVVDSKSPPKSLGGELTTNPQETEPPTGQRPQQKLQAPGKKDTARLNCTRSSVYPVLEEDAELDLTSSQDCAVPEISEESKPRTVIETRSMKRKIAVNSPTVNGNSGAETNSVRSDGESPIKKRTIDSLTSINNPQQESKMAKYIWQPPQLNTVCNPHPKKSLTDFFTNSKAGDKCRVWALLKHIRILSKQPCLECRHVRCYHDWIWSLCTSCGEVLPSSDLRERYQRDVLLSKSSLKCSSCPSQSAALEISLQPFFKLDFCLEDLTSDNNYSVDLSGDYAELFFGVKPSFEWLVGSVPPMFHETTTIFKHQNRLRPFEFCLVNLAKPNEATHVQICDTKLKF